MNINAQVTVVLTGLRNEWREELDETRRDDRCTSFMIGGAIRLSAMDHSRPPPTQGD
jgi:hypothetical protein